MKKVAGKNDNIMLHNCYMYVTSIICNVLFLLFQTQLPLNLKNNNQMLTEDSFFKGFDKLVIEIVMINASIGIMTSLFIKTFNSVLKTFVSAIELILTAILSFVLFGIPIYWNTILAIFIVSVSILVYATNPIETEKLEQKKDNLKVHIKDNESPTKTDYLLDKQIDEKAYTNEQSFLAVV
jgi:drug/metabolite transporter (DMT)-like permease